MSLGDNLHHFGWMACIEKICIIYLSLIIILTELSKRPWIWYLRAVLHFLSTSGSLILWCIFPHCGSTDMLRYVNRQPVFLGSLFHHVLISKDGHEKQALDWEQICEGLVLSSSRTDKVASNPMGLTAKKIYDACNTYLKLTDKKETFWCMFYI